MKLTKEAIGMEKISPSALDCYEQCPRLFYYQNWLGMKLEDDRMHMDFGNAIHSAIEKIYMEYDNHFGGGWSAGNFDNVLERFEEYWKPKTITEESFQKYLGTRAGKDSGFTSSKELYEYMRDDGIAILKSYWDNKERMLMEYDHDFVEFEIPMKIEMRNPENENDKLPIPLSLRIDARNRNKTKMADFKTSKNKYDEAETRKKIQGQCYVFANLMDTGELIRLFDYIVLRKDLKSPDRVEVVQLKYDEADMIAFYFRVKSILQKIANREFERPAKGHANYCQCHQFDERLSVADITLNK